MKAVKRLIVSLLAVALVLAVVSCGGDGPAQQQPTAPAGQSPAAPGQSPAASPGQTPGAAPGESPGRQVSDRDGNPVTLPDSIETIISIGPSNTEILVALGFGGMIVAADFFSDNIAGIAQGISFLDMLAPDGELIISLEPDVIIITGMTRDAAADDPLRIVQNAGITVLYIPTSDTIAGIKDDIRFIADVMGAQARGDEIIAEMDEVISSVRAVGATVADRRTVYFEISPAPWMFSFGSGVFLDEMLGIIGAINVFADYDSWISVADEVVLAADPDVILTNVGFLDDPIGEIKERPGWGGIGAVQNGAVFLIDTDASSRPSHNIIIALLEMARAVYPELH